MMYGSRMRAAAIALVIMIIAPGCGPSVSVPGNSDDSTGAATAGDADGVDAASQEGGGPGPSDVTGAGPDAGPGPDDGTPIPPDVPASTTGDVCIEWASDGCGLDIGAGSFVHGGTPLGEVGPMPPGFAFFAGAPFCDFCIETSRIGSIFFVADPSDIADLGPGDAPPGLELVLDAFEGPLGQELSGIAVMRRDGQEATAEAIFTIDALADPHELGEPFDPADPAILAGNIVTIAGDGWSVHGQFVAAYCPQLNVFAICE